VIEDAPHYGITDSHLLTDGCHYLAQVMQHEPRSALVLGHIPQVPATYNCALGSISLPG
jgi:hypothetical protein